jgi:lysophospholipase L1-like esterase
VLVALGTNDWGVTPAAAFAPAYLDRLARLRERYPEALFICVGVWQSPTQPETVGYDDAVRAGCTSVSGRFVPLSDLYADPANHQAGQADANPADAGYRLVADRVVAVLRGG